MSNYTYYKIEVTYRKKYLFATHPLSLPALEHTTFLLDLFKCKFPQEEGYKISVTKHSDYTQRLSDREVSELV